MCTANQNDLCDRVKAYTLLSNADELATSRLNEYERAALSKFVWLLGSGKALSDRQELLCKKVIDKLAMPEKADTSVPVRELRDFLDRGKSKVVFLVEGHYIKMKYTTPEYTRHPDCYHITLRDNGGYLGRIDYAAKLHLTGHYRDFYTKIIEEINRDPGFYAAEYGHSTGYCSFCSRPLSDDASLFAGYGPMCAKKYGLAWGQVAEIDNRHSINAEEYF